MGKKVMTCDKKRRSVQFPYAYACEQPVAKLFIAEGYVDIDFNIVQPRLLAMCEHHASEQLLMMESRPWIRERIREITEEEAVLLEVHGS